MDQDCELTRISCELHRIGDLLAEPDLLDITSGVVVPVLLGLATLLVAIFAIGVANRANKLQVDLEESRIKREERNKRRELVPDILTWANWQLFIEPGTTPEPPDKAEAFKKLIEHDHRLGDPTMKDLRGWIVGRVEKYQKVPFTERGSVAEPYTDIVSAVESWADDPESIKIRRSAETLRELIDNAIAKLGKDDALTVAAADRMYEQVMAHRNSDKKK
jgi:hypothetical protein